MSASKKQIVVLKKKHEAAKKVKDQVKQDRYDVGVVETEEALKAEVLKVCRGYCLQAWIESLNQARVEAFSIFRKTENVYYPLAIRVSSSANSKADTAFEEADIGRDSPAKVPLPPNSPSKVAEQLGVVKKESDTTKGMAPDTTKPPTAP